MERYSNFEGAKLSRGSGHNVLKEKLLSVLSNARDQAAKIGLHEGAKEYKQWIKEVEQHHVTSEKLKRFLGSQADYYGPKDREYAHYLEALANGTL